MGKIVAAMYLTLDGVMEEPSWTVPYWDDEMPNSSWTYCSAVTRCCSDESHMRCLRRLGLQQR